MNREVKIKSPLGEDVLLFETMRGEEDLGGGFEYQVSALSEKPDLDLSALLGEVITLKVELPKAEFRYFNGYVVSFSMEGSNGRHSRYRIVLRPWTYLLSLTSTSRIFQNKTVPDIVKEIFRDAKLTDFRESLNATYRQLEYSVQYRESDLNYVNRLMEQEGIYTFFEHEDGKHTLVLADSISAHATTSGYEKVPFFPPGETNQHHDDSIANWSVGRQMRTGTFSSSDYDFTRPAAKLLTRLKRPMKQGHPAQEVYDYPGEFLKSSEGEQHVKVRLDELQANFEVAHAEGTVHGLYAGGLFTLEGHPRSDQNNEYLVTAASYTLAGNAHDTGEGEERAFLGRYSCLNSQQQFRAPSRTPRPKVDGPQTATVVGKAGEDISTDQYGRVKVKFHWDLDPARDETSSCWVRVSQVWAGAQWGAMHIPRIGQEVIVDFLEGDPDRPIITGRVYNGLQMPPYGLPENMTQSGIKSRSTPGGTASNFNELRFEDKKGKEELHIQAEKDMSTLVKHDQSTSVGADRSVSVGANHSVSVTGTQTTTVTKDETQVYKANRKMDVTGTNADTVTAAHTGTYKAGRTETVTAGDTLTVTSKDKKIIVANGAFDIEVNQHLKVTKASTSMTIDDNFVVDASGKLDLHNPGTSVVGEGTKLALKANSEITISCGAASISMKSDGTIEIMGTTVKIGNANNNAAFEPTGTTINGVKITSASVGMHEITGALIKVG